MMAYTGGSTQKGYFFGACPGVYERVGILLVEVLRKGTEICRLGL